MVKIRLKRLGTQKRPYYRVVVMDALKPRDGKAIEEIGTYHRCVKALQQFQHAWSSKVKLMITQTHSIVVHSLHDIHYITAR